ncbi:Nif3-like dinuclear metal center hexameric protein [Enterococcus sp. JM4C]|uniref:Nif3-like dinuclear metal center hexameric protein n=1 Tax=Candidatus Enterococcus huntleyi TaxID=1857217 RepID=UPI00137B7D05|nr:Nif3-like dinuclear metal center hexameric protein [Enterococcus sp. JM4C]KAF1298679.1 Nif3-like dinuclear metal center hexameric protein [Enterococcus sp. JM4C]
MTKLTGNEFIQRFETYCPLWLAEEGDPVGLHIGTLNKPIERVMMTLDVRPEVVSEAIEKKIDLLIAKHPPIFRPVSRLTTDDPQQKMYADLLANNVAVYAAHTNMDIIENGLNDWFCEALDLQVEDYLTKTHEIPYEKLAVYVPVEAAQQMREALADAGAGEQGNYQHTSFSTIGTGRFTPIGSANPVIGELNRPEQVQEAKIEVIFPKPLEKAVLKVMHEAHPYEEPAYDLFSLNNPPKTYGLGRVGTLTDTLPLPEFIAKVKETFHLDGLRIVEPAEKLSTVKRVAICGGSGEKFYKDAINKKADVYITGDIYYHTAHDMQAAGITAIDPGHYIESLCKEKMVEQFNQWKRENNWEVDFLISETSTQPFAFK